MPLDGMSLIPKDLPGSQRVAPDPYVENPGGFTLNGQGEPLPWEQEKFDEAKKSKLKNPCPQCHEKECAEGKSYCSEECRDKYWPDIPKIKHHETSLVQLKAMQDQLKKWGQESAVKEREWKEYKAAFYKKAQLSDYEKVEFTIDEINAYKAIKEEEDRHHDTNYFMSENRWIGHMGEDAVGRLIPYLVKVTENNRAVCADFMLGSQEVDVKTSATKWEVDQTNMLMIPEPQMRKHQTDLFVGCHHQLMSGFVTVVGWTLREDVQTDARLYKKGDELPGFTFQADALVLPFSHLYSLSCFPTEETSS